MTQFDSRDGEFAMREDGPGVSGARFVVAGRCERALRLFREPSSRTRAKLTTSEEFATLASQWRAETRYISSASERTAHPAYLRIIGMGPRVLPFVLSDLEVTHDDWSTALVALTGEDPTSEADWGDAERLTRAWVAWDRRRGECA